MALPLMIHRLRHGAIGERMAMLTALCGFCLFGALSLAQVRWSGEVQAVDVAALGAHHTEHHEKRMSRLSLGRTARAVAQPGAVTALLLQLAPEAFASTVPDRMPMRPQAATGTKPRARWPA